MKSSTLQDSGRVQVIDLHRVLVENEMRNVFSVSARQSLALRITCVTNCCVLLHLRGEVA